MYLRIVVGMALGGILTASAPAATGPAGTRSISLQECLDLALSRNLDVQIEYLAANIARLSLNSAYGAYDPLFSFRAGRQFLSQPGDFDPQKFNPDFPYELKTDTTELGLGGSLPTGLSYDLRTRAGYKSAATDFSADPDDGAAYFWGIRNTNNYFAGARFTAQQHLLKDFWIDETRQLIRIRRKELKMSQQAVRFQVMCTVLAIELGYYDVIAAHEQIRVQEKSVELRQQFLDETRRRVELGDLPPLDADQAETQFQNALTALTAAREASASLQNALKSLLTDDFRQWVGLELTPTDPLLALPVETRLSESFQQALKQRPDLAEARLAVEKSDVTVQFRLNQLYPNLDLVGGYGGSGVRHDSSDAASDAFNFRYPEYSYGVVLTFPLSRTAERNNYRASQAAKQLAELQLKKAEQAVFVQVADWVNRVQSRFRLVDSTRKARTFAESALAAEQKKLQNGLSTSFFVLQLQETLTAARMAEVQALTDYNKAVAQLAFAEGTTLERHRLVVEVR